ncbi:hypothetical protein ACS0TY_013750 [Phlomoides rotata]
MQHVLSLLDQIEMFKDYIAKLEQIVGLERTSALLSESLFIVVSGSNDITNTYFGMPVRKTQYDVTSYADLLVSYASIFVKELHELGARKIGVFGLPPLGCLPSQRTLKGGVERKCIDLYNEVAMLFNHKLSAEINSINNQCSTGSGRATYIDIYSLPLDLIHHPHKYGFKISNKGCCGTGTIEVAFLCKYTCWNVPEYVFWDSFHLTEKAYRLLVHEILKNNIKSLIFSSVCLGALNLNLPRGITFPAVVVFGDSLVDTGNNNYLKTIAKSNYPPYGQDFMGGKPTGRFSNGKVPPDLMAEELGIKQLLPPYLDPSLQDEDLLTGVNFASGGSGYDPLTSQVPTVLSLSDQLELFKEYITKVKSIVGEEKTSEIVRQSLIAVAVGSNDISNTYFLLPIRKAHYDVPSYANLLVRQASSFVQELYGVGVRRMGVTGLPPVGCLPSQRTLRGGVQRNCIDEYNEAAQLFNHKLEAELNSLNNQRHDALIIYIDIFTLPLDFINNPNKYGFKIGDKGCCGTGNIEVTYLCKFAAYTCPNVEDHVFWDSFHPTEKAYTILVHDIIKQFLTKICANLQC